MAAEVFTGALPEFDEEAPIAAPVAQKFDGPLPEFDEESAPVDDFGVGPPANATTQEAPKESWADTFAAIPAQVRALAARTIAGLRQKSLEELATANGTGISKVDSSESTPAAIEKQQKIIAESYTAPGVEPKGEQNILQRGVQGAAGSLAIGLPSLALGVATRNPALATAAMYPLTEGENYAQLRSKDNVDPERAAKFAALNGIIEVGTEFVPAKVLFKTGSGPYKKLVEFLAAELPGESVATIGQEVSDSLARLPEDASAAEVIDTLKQGAMAGVKQLPDTAVTTLLAGGVQSGAVSLADKATASQPYAPLALDRIYKSQLTAADEVARSEQMPQSLAAEYAERTAMEKTQVAAESAVALMSGAQVPDSTQKTLDQISEEAVLGYAPYRALRDDGLSHEAALAVAAREPKLAWGISAAAANEAEGADLDTFMRKWVGRTGPIDAIREKFSKGKDWTATLTDAAATVDDKETAGAMQDDELAAAATNYDRMRRAATDPAARISKADLDEAQARLQEVAAARGQAALVSGKLSPEAQQQVAGTLKTAATKGIETKAKPVQGQVQKRGAELNEFETAHLEALNKVATADTIEAPALTDLVSNKLAKIGRDGRPMLLPEGRRQLTALTKRQEAADVQEKPASTERVQPEKMDKPVTANDVAGMLKKGTITDATAQMLLRSAESAAKAKPAAAEAKTTSAPSRAKPSRPQIKLPAERRAAKQAQAEATARAAAEQEARDTAERESKAAEETSNRNAAREAAKRIAEEDKAYAEKAAAEQAQRDADFEAAKNQQGEQEVDAAPYTQKPTGGNQMAEAFARARERAPRAARIFEENPDGKRIKRPEVFEEDMQGVEPGDVQSVGSKNGVEFFRSPSTGGFYARKNGRTIGYITHESSGGTDLTVAQEHYRKGVGSELLTRFVRENPDAKSGGFSDAGAALLRAIKSRTESPRRAGPETAGKQHVVDRVAARVERAFGVKVVVADTPADLPDVGQLRLPSTRGAFVFYPDGTGQMYMVRSNHDSELEAAKTAVHEIVGHYGLRGLLGGASSPEYARVMGQIRASFPAQARALAKATQINWDHPKPAVRLRLRNLAAEELVAYSTERLLTSGKEQGVWAKIVATARRLLRSLQILNGWTTADVEDLIYRARDSVVKNNAKSETAKAEFEEQMASAPRAARPARAPKQSAPVQSKRLDGLPEKVEVPGHGLVEVGPFEPARAAAEAYRAKNKIEGKEPTEFVRVNPDFARQVADAYDKMEHAPNDPKVKAAYAAMIKETLAQYQEIKKTGLKIEFIEGADPYAASPRLAIEDVKRNNHLWVFPTEAGFGDNTVNIGLNTNDGGKITADEAREALQSLGLAITRSTQHQSDTEPTLIASINRAMTPEEANRVSEMLKQDAIAQFAAGKGELYGPKADAWGPFNPEYFLTHEGKRLSQVDSLSDNPLLAKTKEKIGGRTLLANDVFRIVHDYFGHIQEGNGFRADGEENAWRIHASMYSPKARAAMTTETRGQNSWLNYGPFGDRNRTATADKTVFAPQKTGLLPEKFWREPAAPKLSKSQQATQDAIKGLAHYLTPKEKENLTRITAEGLVKLFNQLPDEKDMGAAALAGQAKRGWYRQSAEALSNIFGPDAPRFAALLAATSPQTSVEMNLANAVRIWKGWIEAGRPTDGEKIYDVMLNNVMKGEGTGVLPAWVPNTIRALSTENPESVTLSGPKVNSFAANLRGDVNEVTLDTWMANFALVDQNIFGGKLKSGDNPGKQKGYLAYSARVRQTAEYLTKMTGETWTPAEVQETVWSWAKASYEQASSMKGLATVRDLVESNEVSDALINATPDFATLIQGPEYEGILREAGYGEAIDRAVAAQAAAGNQSQKIAPLAGDRERLLTAAGRLDELAERRYQEKYGQEPSEEDGDIPYARIRKTGDPALDAFLDKIGAPPRTLRQRWQEWTAGWREDLIYHTIDDLYGINAAEKEAGIAMPDRGYIDARMARSAAMLTQSIVTDGIPIWQNGVPTIQPGTVGLAPILKTLGDKADLFGAYLVARRAQRLMTEGRENLFSNADIGAGMRLEQQHPEFKVAAAAYDKLQKGVLDFAEAAGYIDPATRGLWEKGDYVPFYRINAPQIAQQGSLGRVKDAIRRLKGGQDNVGDPLENIMRNWMGLVDGSLKARATRTIIDNLNGTGKVTQATTGTVPTVQQFLQTNPAVTSLLRASGMNVSALTPAQLQGLQNIAQQPLAIEGQTVTVWRGGKKEVWNVHDPLLFRSMVNINEKAWHPILEVFKAPKRLITAMITHTPSFAVRNLMRDMFHAAVVGAVNSNTTVVPIVDTIKGTVSQLRRDQTAIELAAGGGAFSHGFVNSSDMEGAAKTLRRMTRNSKGPARVIDTAAKGWALYRDLLNASENSHRSALYKRLVAAGKSHKEALFEARDLMDFSMRGANPVMRFMIETVPFMNPAIQGMYRLGHGVNRQNSTAVLMRAMLLVIASAALAAWNADNEDYKALTTDQKSTYWHFFNTFQDGDHIMIPKPFEVGTIFGTLPELVVDAFISDEPDRAKQAFSLAGHALGNAVHLDPTPQLVKPALELAMNKNFFTKAPILNQGDIGVLPEDQDSPGVSPTFRLLSRTMPEFAPDFLRSPKQVQHLVRGYLGSMVDYGLLATDKLSRQALDEPPPPEQYYNDWPGLRDFYKTGPARRTKYSEAMFALVLEAGKVHQSMENAKKEGDVGRIDELLAEKEDLLVARKPFESAQKQVLDLRKKQRALQLDSAMDPKVRRKLIDELQQSMNEIAESVWDIRPGSKLNPSTAADLFGRSKKEQAKILRDAGMPATAAMVGGEE